MAVNLPNLVLEEAITDASGRPTLVYHKWWQTFRNTLVSILASLQEQLLAIQAAQATADNAQTTANSALDRANHTGTQLAATISDFAETARAETEAELVAGSNITITPSGAGATRQLTLAATAVTGGALILDTRTITATGSPTANDYLLIVDATAGAVTVNLPAAASSTGRVLQCKKKDASANAMTLDGNGAETIDGAATLSTTTQYAAFTVACDGTEWWIL